MGLEPFELNSISHMVEWKYLQGPFCPILGEREFSTYINFGWIVSLVFFKSHKMPINY